LDSGWQFWIDRGGTFTDCIGRDARGRLHVTKVLSSDRAPLDGIRQILGISSDTPIPPCDIRMGTTLATNALLERKGRKPTLIVTRGFADLLAIGDQTRPHLFDLAVRCPAPLPADIHEVDARRGADGTAIVHVPAAPALGTVNGVTAIAILNDYADGSLERDIAKLLPGETLCSHEVDPQLGYLARTATTVLEAYLRPVLQDYLRTLQDALPGSRLRVMQSSGVLIDADQLQARHAILSGPAGGVVAVGQVARAAGFTRAIGFDMGGTSTDVSRWDGTVEHVYESDVAGVRVRAPMVAVHTIAAGGGSICRFDGARMTVGPDSAGAVPGPLCYGHPDAHELTLTDVNLVLGRIDAGAFPIALSLDRAKAAVEAVAKLRGVSVEAVAQGFVDVAVAHMAEAIRTITLGRGHDPRDHALVAFGGAAGQHACAVASVLGITTVVVHPLAGLMSALGMGYARDGWSGVRDAGRVLLEDADLEPLFAALERACTLSGATFTRKADLRYRGSDAALTLTTITRAAFEEAHQHALGCVRAGHPIEVVSVRLDAHGPATVDLGATDDVVRGTVVTVPGWSIDTQPNGCMILRGRRPARARVDATRVDPVLLEVFHGLFQSIAEQMGRVLERTALSTNIRERRDFSCAVFDAAGGLVANAPHIPVHLGAMGESVRHVFQRFPDMAAGDAFATNDPAHGGSHLPDITVVSPVFVDGRRFFVACRGHHADVGGMVPGSMPPFSTTLADEGVVITPMRIAADGRFSEDDVRALLSRGPYPARSPDENIADLEAQLAANLAGAELVRQACARHGSETVAAYMQHIQDNATDEVRAALRRVLPDGERRFEDTLDDGTRVTVAIRREGERVVIDFTGTSDEVLTNLNAPRAVALSAVIYVIRSLVRRPIPLNGGCLADVDVRIAEGSLLSPRAGRAVVAGNVETSQRVVDVLLGAFGVAAASQGTMNNLAFGDATFGYYETLGGGAGAGPDWDGASAVHTHMTNTRITDPEVLESRYPVRLWQFAIRRGSGGAGRHRGGDGLVRELEALVPLSVSIIAERRVRAPYGLAGGLPGACGRSTIAGRVIGSRGAAEVRPGDRIVIETPGGGGYGCS